MADDLLTGALPPTESEANDLVLDFEPETSPPVESSEQPAIAPAERLPEQEEKKQGRDYKREYENLQAALREERQRNREALASFDGLKKELENHRAERESLQKKQEFDTDPLTTLQKELEDLKRDKQERMTQQEQMDAQRRQQEAVRQFVITAREEFEADHPDYQQAYAHVMNLKSQEMQALGIRDQYSLNQVLENEIQRIVNHAITIGKNPAELIYNMAKVNGFNNQPTALQADDKLSRIEQGQKAGSNSGRGSAAPRNTTTLRLSDIDSMSADEFEKAWAKLKSSGKLG